MKIDLNSTSSYVFSFWAEFETDCGLENESKELKVSTNTLRVNFTYPFIYYADIIIFSSATVLRLK